MTPFRFSKGTIYEGGFRVPCSARWPGKIKPGTIENGIFSGLDWFPTLLTAAGNPDITKQLLDGVKLGEKTCKNHLDGYDQTNLLVNKGPSAPMKFFILVELNLELCGLIISNSSSMINQQGGQVLKLL